MAMEEQAETGSVNTPAGEAGGITPDIHEERNHMLEQYRLGYPKLIDALSQFPSKALTYKHSSDDWSIHEIIIHLADAEVNGYLRLCRAIAEPGLPVMAYDEARWSQELHYADQNVDEALVLLQWLRARTYRLLRQLPDEKWANTYDHPEQGMVNLDGWLDIYAGHVDNHVAQMWMVYTSWIQQDW
jgi:uncharacterized damage-inducible protein DinB